MGQGESGKSPGLGAQRWLYWVASKTESSGLEGTSDVPFTHEGRRAQRCEVIGAGLLLGKQGPELRFPHGLTHAFPNMT